MVKLQLGIVNLKRNTAYFPKLNIFIKCWQTSCMDIVKALNDLNLILQSKNISCIND